MAASGKWLNHPVAVLKATNDADGKMVSALVKLSAPQYNASQHTLYFKVTCALSASCKHIADEVGARGIRKFVVQTARRICEEQRMQTRCSAYSIRSCAGA